MLTLAHAHQTAAPSCEVSDVNPVLMPANAYIATMVIPSCPFVVHTGALRKKAVAQPPSNDAGVSRTGRPLRRSAVAMQEAESVAMQEAQRKRARHGP